MKKLLCFLTAILSIFLMSVPIEAKEFQNLKQQHHLMKNIKQK